MNKWYKNFIAGTLVVCVVSCSQGKPASDGIRIDPLVEKPVTLMPEGTLDAELGRLGQTLSGFGGLYFDEKGDLTVLLTKDQPSDLVRDAVVQVFGKDFLLRGADPHGEGRKPGTTAAIKLMQATYEVLDLLRWRDQIIDVLSLKGTNWLDMDEAQNRVAIGFTPEANIEEIQKFVLSRDVPLEAVLFEKTQPVELMQGTVRDIFRPIPGGVEIARGGSLCTLGFNATLNGVVGFVTNAHCVRSSSQDVFQPGWPQLVASAYPSLPGPLYSGGACPFRQTCLFSDAAFVPYLQRDFWGNPISLAQGLSLARPVSWNGRIDLPSPNARFTLSGARQFVVMGEALDKVGRATGWTYGRVSDTCRIEPWDAKQRQLSNFLMCQDEVTRSSNQTFQLADHGDSGSPVFSWNGSTGGTLVGILWGGSTVNGVQKFFMSNFGNISRDLRNLSLR